MCHVFSPEEAKQVVFETLFYSWLLVKFYFLFKDYALKIVKKTFSEKSWPQGSVGQSQYVIFEILLFLWLFFRQSSEMIKTFINYLLTTLSKKKMGRNAQNGSANMSLWRLHFIYYLFSIITTNDKLIYKLTIFNIVEKKYCPNNMQSSFFRQKNYLNLCTERARL